MAHLTINIPDDLNDQDRAALEERLSRVVEQAVQARRSSPSNGRSLMDLAGCLKHEGPPISKTDARAAAKRHVVDNFRKSESSS